MTERSLRFHRSLYPFDAVRRAAQRFGGVARVRVEETDADTLVLLGELPERLAERLPDELANHALYEAILARRAG